MLVTSQGVSDGKRKPHRARDVMRSDVLRNANEKGR